MSRQFLAGLPWRHGEEYSSYAQITAASSERRGDRSDTRVRCALRQLFMIIILSAVFVGLDTVNEAAAHHKRRNPEGQCKTNAAGDTCQDKGNFLLPPDRMEGLIESLERSGSTCGDSDDMPGAVECVERDTLRGWGVWYLRPLDDQEPPGDQ